MKNGLSLRKSIIIKAKGWSTLFFLSAVMNRTTVAFTIVVVTLLTLSITVAYYGSVNNSHQDNFLPTTSPIPTSSPSPAITPSPTQTSNPSLTSTASAFFDGPLGGFSITSPSNKMYNSTTLTLAVTGQVIIGSNVELLMKYSLVDKAFSQFQ